MDESFRISVPVEIDSDGFLRRQCPNCDQQFKWLHETDEVGHSEPAEEYFCPLCGAPAPTGDWSTPEQLDAALAAGSEQISDMLQGLVTDAFKGVRGVKVKPSRDFDLHLGASDPTVEANDMVLVESPCHPEEPIKVPDNATDRIHCLVCGAQFTA